MKSFVASLLSAILLLLQTSPVLGFVAPKQASSLSLPSPAGAAISYYSHLQKKAPASMLLSAATADNNDDGDEGDIADGGSSSRIPASTTTAIMIALASATTALPAEAAGVLPTALWAYAHYLSILAITGCLAAERTIVQADMTVEEEETIVKIDLVYGLMAALLIVSGFARASNFGKGGEFYIREILFWVKMASAGVWGGLSLFPSRKKCRAPLKCVLGSMFHSLACSWYLLFYVHIHSYFLQAQLCPQKRGICAARVGETSGSFTASHQRRASGDSEHSSVGDAHGKRCVVLGRFSLAGRCCHCHCLYRWVVLFLRKTSPYLGRREFGCRQ